MRYRINHQLPLIIADIRKVEDILPYKLSFCSLLQSMEKLYYFNKNFLFY